MRGNKHRKETRIDKTDILVKQTHSRNRKYNERKQAHTQETITDKTETSKF
jgi:hypothetical protein